LPVIVVGGSNKNVGKTSLICCIIAAFPDFRWTAVKITSHRYGQIEPVWEEPAPEAREEGQRTDTARFLAAGARRALLVSASATVLPWREMEAALAGERNVIYESNRVAAEIRPDVCLAILCGTATGFKASFVPFLSAADAVIAPPGAEIALQDAAAGIPVLRMGSPGEISPELMGWLRDRLVAE
jgi:hypothetical protein